jgi:sec-independent protein translocase protein TatB
VFSLGGSEILLIAVLALLLFGPDKIPQMARTVGRFMREFNKYKDIMESTVRAEIYKEDWTKDAGKPDPKPASERISQAAGAVQDLVAEQKAKEAGDGPTAAAAGPPAEKSRVPEPAGPERAPTLATDEDEEDEE